MFQKAFTKIISTAVLCAVFLSVPASASYSVPGRSKKTEAVTFAVSEGYAEERICEKSEADFISLFTPHGSFVCEPLSGRIAVGSAVNVPLFKDGKLSDTGCYWFPVYASDKLSGFVLTEKMGKEKNGVKTVKEHFIQLPSDFSETERFSLFCTYSDGLSIYSIDSDGKTELIQQLDGSPNNADKPDADFASVSHYNAFGEKPKLVTETDVRAADRGVYPENNDKVELRLVSMYSSEKYFCASGNGLGICRYDRNSSDNSKFAFTLKTVGERDGETVYTLTAANGAKIKVGGSDRLLLRFNGSDGTYRICSLEAPEIVLGMKDMHFTEGENLFEEHQRWRIEFFK